MQRDNKKLNFQNISIYLALLIALAVFVGNANMLFGDDYLPSICSSPGLKVDFEAKKDFVLNNMSFVAQNSGTTGYNLIKEPYATGADIVYVTSSQTFASGNTYILDFNDFDILSGEKYRIQAVNTELNLLPRCTASSSNYANNEFIIDYSTNLAKTSNSLTYFGMSNYPTCDDDIKNQDETGVDCGGDVCGACPIYEDSDLLADYSEYIGNNEFDPDFEDGVDCRFDEAFGYDACQINEYNSNSKDSYNNVLSTIQEFINNLIDSIRGVFA
jgi:hypothetical protein